MLSSGNKRSARLTIQVQSQYSLVLFKSQWAIRYSSPQVMGGAVQVFNSWGRCLKMIVWNSLNTKLSTCSPRTIMWVEAGGGIAASHQSDGWGGKKWTNCSIFCKSNALCKCENGIWVKCNRTERCGNTLAESPAASGWACFFFPASQCTNTRSTCHRHRWKCEHEGHWAVNFPNQLQLRNRAA